MSVEFWFGVACVVVGFACCVVVVIVLATRRGRLPWSTIFFIVAASLALFLGGLCLAGGQFLDRNQPSQDDIMTPLPPKATSPSPGPG